jgi:hypothetical protein
MAVSEEMDANPDRKIEQPAAISSAHLRTFADARAKIGKEQGSSPQLGNPLEVLGVEVRLYYSTLCLHFGHHLHDKLEATLEHRMRQQPVTSEKHSIQFGVAQFEEM